MTIVSSTQASQLFAQQQQAMQMSAGPSWGGHIPSPASGALSRGISSTVMGGMQALPGALGAVGTVGALAAGAAGVSGFGLSAGGAALGGGLGAMLGGPAGLIGGAAMGALPLGVAAPLIAAPAMAAYGFSQMQQGMQQNNMMQQALGGFNFGNPGAATGRGFSQGQAGQITSMARGMASGLGPGGFGDITQAIAAIPDMGLMQGVRDAEEFQKKFRGLMNTVKSMTTVLGVSLQEALPFFQGLRSSGFYNQQDIVAQSVNRQMAGSVGITGPQFMANLHQGASLAQAYGSRRASGASLNQSVAMGIGMGVQEGILDEDMVTEAAGGRMGGEAYSFLAGRMSQQTFRFTTGGKGRKMLRALGEVKEGRYTGAIDRGQLTRWRAGEIGFGNLGGDRGGSDKSFRANESRLRGGAASALGTDLIGQMVESAMGDKDLEGLEREDVVSTLMQKYTNLGQAEAELYAEMARESRTLSRQRRVRASQEVDRQVSEAQLRRTGLGAQYRRHVGQPFSSAVSQPLQAMGQVLSSNIERETQGFFDSVYGRYTSQVTDESRNAFQWGLGLQGGGGMSGDISGLNYGTAGGVAGFAAGAAGGALVGAGVGAGVGMILPPVTAAIGAGVGALAGGIYGAYQGSAMAMGGTAAYRSDIRGARSRHGGSVPISVLEGINAMESRRAGMGGGLTAADVGIDARELKAGGSSMVGALISDKSKANWFSRGQDAGTLTAEDMRETLRWTSWGQSHLSGRTYKQQREVVRAMAQQAGIALHGDQYAGNIVGRGLSRGRAGALEDLMGAGTGMLGASEQEAHLRAVLSGSHGTKAAAFLGGREPASKKIGDLRRLMALKQRKDNLSADESRELQVLTNRVGDLDIAGASALIKALKNYGDDDELKEAANTYYVALNSEGAAAFSAGAMKMGAALQREIAAGGERYADLPPEARKALEGWAEGLSNLGTEDAFNIMSGGGTGSDITSRALASAMEGMTDEQRASVADILGGMGEQGAAMYSVARLRMRGGKAFKGVTAKTRGGMRSKLEKASGLGAGSITSLMEGVEALGGDAGPESKMAYDLIKKIEAAGSVGETDASSLVDLLLTAVERGLISRTAAGGKKSGSMAGDLVDLSTSMKDAMTAGRLFVQAVSDALPELESIKELSTEYAADPGTE